MSLKQSYTFLHEDISFISTPELDKFFFETEISLSNDTELAIPKTSITFYITVDAIFFGLGARLFQPKSTNKVQVP